MLGPIRNHSLADVISLCRRNFCEVIKMASVQRFGLGVGKGFRLVLALNVIDEEAQQGENKGVGRAALPYVLKWHQNRIFKN